jgi:chemotaxis protein histidine kinase CheA
MSAIMNFESTVYVNEQLNRLMVNTAQDLAHRSIKACAEHYKFDAEEALRFLGLENVKLARTRPVDEKPKKEKVVIARPAFPMPYNGEFNDACCFALRQNSGLYTQCQAVRKNGDFCKQCQVLADKTEGIPEYGTIQMRQAVGIFEYTDPKGRKPVAYTKVMKKYKINLEQVLEEAGKFNININSEHFAVAEVDSKRGRPSSQKEKAPKEAKGSKGRPKKAKKVLQIEGDDDDLFASLVADANSNSGDEAVIAPKKKGKSEEEKEAERLAKEAEKEAKKLALENAKAEKEAKLALEKLEREHKKQLEDEARAAKKKAEEEEKAAKKAALELAKAEKEAKLAAEKAAKAQAQQTKTKKPAAAAAAAAKEPEVEEEPDVVKKIEFEGKKYLKSKKSGIIYDYQEYIKNGEQVMVGKWNESKNKIDFNNSGEESEEEYDM